MLHIIASVRSWVNWYRPVTYGTAVTIASDKVATASANLVAELARLDEFFRILGVDVDAVDEAQPAEDRRAFQVVR